MCERKHGTPGHFQFHSDCNDRTCIRPGGTVCAGGRSSFCKSSQIRQHLDTSAYPFDKRCGCPICPICKRGRPCEQCNGRCVVCLGHVPPGALELPVELS